MNENPEAVARRAKWIARVWRAFMLPTVAAYVLAPRAAFVGIMLLFTALLSLEALALTARGEVQSAKARNDSDGAAVRCDESAPPTVDAVGDRAA